MGEGPDDPAVFLDPRVLFRQVKDHGDFLPRAVGDVRERSVGEVQLVGAGRLQPGMLPAEIGSPSGKCRG